uniref:Ubiquitin-like protease family profile domain-containing protein n=1 Tax=Brassica oleracea var. oleracea TaxID=109376 RepID=A0A0D3DLX0_BRAOL
MSYSLDDLHVSRPESLKMDLPELPPRMFTLGEVPAAIRSISYHSDDTKLFKALFDFLTADEYEDLKASKLGVFITFKDLGFGWTSRLVHFILCFQLDIKKKFELWSLVVSQPVRFPLIEFEHLTGRNCDYIKDLENPRCEVTKEMVAFWEKMGVDLDTGPRYIEGKKFSTATPASLARLVMNLEKFENYPWGRVAFKVLMDSLKAKDLTQTGYTVDGFIQVLQINVNNFVQKDLDEMFPEWDGDVEDPAADNIIKVMFNDPGWKWTMDCWQVTGTHKVVKIEVSPVKTEVSPVKSESVVKEESSRPRKKARKGSSVSAEAPAAGSDGFGMTKEQIERAFKDISDVMSDGFGTCLREIKLFGDRMGAVEKKVGITKKRSSSDDLQLTKHVHEPGSESVNGAKAGQKEAKEPSVTTEPSSSTELCLVKPADDLPSDEPSVLILDKQVYTASDSLLEEARRQTKKETAMVNLREKVGQGYDPFAPYDKRKSKELTEWLEEDPSYKLPLKKSRRCPSRFYQVLRTPLEWLTDHARYLLFANLRRFGGVDVDDIYAPVNFKNQHWFAIWISILKRHIVIWDSIIKHISPEELDELMEPFVTMVPYLLVECAVSDEQKVQYTLEPYTYERQTVGVPQCRAGDCGPFTLKYIECHALGMEFPKALCPRNGKTIREKMAVDIFQELPMCHEWENQVNDENLGTYE